MPDNSLTPSQKHLHQALVDLSPPGHENNELYISQENLEKYVRLLKEEWENKAISSLEMYLNVCKRQDMPPNKEIIINRLKKI